MHISPCGWYCFSEPYEWVAKEYPKCTMLLPDRGHGRIELISARKEMLIEPESIMDMHESMVREFPAQVKETALDRTDNGLDYVVTTVSDHEFITVLVHVYWSRYCVFLRLDTPIDENLIPQMEAMDHVVFSLEALTVD